MLDEPLNLLFDHLLGWQEHVLQDLHELRLELRVGDALSHLHNFYYGLLFGERKTMHVFSIFLIGRYLLAPIVRKKITSFCEN